MRHASTLTLLLAFAFAAPAQAQDVPPPRGGSPCATEQGPVKVDAVETRADGDWRDVSGDLCVFVTYADVPGGATPPLRYASYSLTDARNFSQDISAKFPEGTRMRVKLTSLVTAPLFTTGSMRDPLAAIDGQSITIEGETTSVRFAREYGADGAPNCAGATDEIPSFFSGLVQYDTDGTSPTEVDFRRYRGAYFGSNAQTTGMPIVAADGRTIEVFVGGCGDSSPDTLEGYFQGFLPEAGLKEMGFTTQVLDALTDPVADEVMTLEDNGEPAPDANFDVQEEAEVESSGRRTTEVPGGLSIDYRMSFSEHRISATADRRNLKIARTCVKKKGKLKTTGKGAKRKLVCKPRKKKR